MKKILIGISGGIDSAVSAAVLKNRGYRVTGVHLLLNESGEDVETEIKRIKQYLDIEIIMHDCRVEFEKRIVESFIDSYCTGRTPNPCIKCNAEIKFQALVSLADELGIHFISTGHYAKIEESSGDYFINRGEDLLKDQSYMLYRLKKEWLSRIIFPLGSLEKDTVREMGKKFFHKRINQQKESQDNCFIKNISTADFIKQRSGFKDTRGPILDINGKILGWHRGIFGYTIGQRKGLGLSGGPWFVYSIDPSSNAIIVSSDEFPVSSVINCYKAIWHERINNSNIYYGQHRYRAVPFPLKIESTQEDGFVVKTLKPVKTPAPGQSLVIYRENRVLGGGIIAFNNKEVKE